MKLIVGLGNPGAEYEATRHNIGFQVVEAYARHHSIRWLGRQCGAEIARGASDACPFVLAKPQTFMNRSGEAVVRLLHLHNLSVDDLILIIDEIDIPCGVLRIRTGGRSGGHRGVQSIIEEVGSSQILRLKIGVGRNEQMDLSDYLLSRVLEEDQKKIDTSIQNGVAVMDLLLEGKIAQAMNQYHSCL